jgi:tetratricopeptide (TPR) repeat protein
VRAGSDTLRGAGLALLALLLAMLVGCATPQTDRLLASPTELPRQVELDEVAFFPQETHQCGPAALATVMSSTALNITPDELVPEVYLPGRKGSLQFELLAAARRHGRVPYVLSPQLDAITAELAAGNPVLVLQNLGIAVAPFWHYAVVVGYDLASAELILRSGRERRRVTSLSTFEHTWRRGDYWAVVVLPPEKIAQTAEELPYLQAVVALERLERWQDASTAYTSALQRWPESLGAHIGAGNSRYALGDLHGAEQMFRAAIHQHPQAAVAFNNLAQVLADQQRWDDALVLAQQAVMLGGDNADIFQQTLTGIEAHIAR